MQPRTSPQPRDLAVRLALALAALVVGSELAFITFVTLAGPWLGCVWLAADRPTIDAVFPGSPAALAGLRPGDRLISADGVAVIRPVDGLVFRIEPGDRPDGAIGSAALRVHDAIVDYSCARRHSQAGCRVRLVRPSCRMVYLRACILDCLSTVEAPLRTFGLGDSSCAGRDLHSLQCQGICSRLARAVARSAPPGRGAGPLGWFFAPMMLLFMLEFPRRRFSRFAASMALPAVLISPLLIYHGVYGSLGEHPEVAAAAPVWLAPAAMAATWGALFATLLAGIGQYHRETDLNHRRRLRVILCGVLISAAGSLAEGWLSVNGWRWLNPAILVAGRASCTLLNAAMAISFAYAVLRHRLFDLSIIIRLGIRYALSKGLVLCLAPGLATLFVIDLWRHSERPLALAIRQESTGYLILALLAVVAHIGRRRWLAALDRRFYRSRCDGRRVLSDFISKAAQSNRPGDASATCAKCGLRGASAQMGCNCRARPRGRRTLAGGTAGGPQPA